MMDTTSRWGLALLAAGQAQKEMTHNEALLRLDLLTQASVVAVGVNAPPADPVPGQCWVVGDAPEGAWAGHAKAIAGFTAGGWRYVAPQEGARAWSLGDKAEARFLEGAWSSGFLRGRILVDGVQVVGAREPSIPAPAGGGTVDAEARAVIETILGALENHGLIEGR